MNALLLSPSFTVTIDSIFHIENTEFDFMPLSPEDRQLKKRIYQSLVDEPLQPEDPRYIPIYQIPGGADPIARLMEHIELTDVESVQFFSGFRGSGKTTELFRLKQDLEQEGYIVLYANALKYINPADEIDISDLLIVLAGSFSDAIEELTKENIQVESYWTRLTAYLSNTNLDITEAGIKTGVDLKVALSTTPTFRQNLQKTLANRIGELKNNVDKFIEDGVKAIRGAYSEDTRIVFIFDSLEQIRGSLFNEQAVIQSVERVFSQHHKLLELPYIHAIYTVPPWLKFVMPNNIKPIVLLHSIMQWKNDNERTKLDGSGTSLRQLVLERFSEEGFKKFFGDDPNVEHSRADKLIDICGGHFRDLLSLLREAVLPTNELPISDKDIETAIANVKSSFLPISLEDAKWLAKIAESRSDSLPDIKGENVGRLTRYLDTHLVLYFRNGEDWYDVHPLIRDEVIQIVKSAAEIKEKQTQT